MQAKRLALCYYIKVLPYYAILMNESTGFHSFTCMCNLFYQIMSKFIYLVTNAGQI